MLLNKVNQIQPLLIYETLYLVKNSNTVEFSNK